MRAATATLTLALLLAGCATPDGDDAGHGPGRGPGGRDRGPPAPPGPTLFISPSGQPFRAATGEPYPVGVWFAQADRNGDGHIDRAEFRTDAEAFFHVLDANHDGVVDGFEVTDYEQKIAPEISGAYGGDSSSGAPGGRRHRPNEQRGASRPGGAGSAAVLQGAAVFGLLNEPEPVSAADLDLSGRITLSEFMTVTDRRFDQLDPKGRGFLTLADLPKTSAQVMAEPRKKR